MITPRHLWQSRNGDDLTFFQPCNSDEILARPWLIRFVVLLFVFVRMLSQKRREISKGCWWPRPTIPTCGSGLWCLSCLSRMSRWERAACREGFVLPGIFHNTARNQRGVVMITCSFDELFQFFAMGDACQEKTPSVCRCLVFECEMLVFFGTSSHLMLWDYEYVRVCLQSILKIY